jgi:hypothetical protein
LYSDDAIYNLAQIAEYENDIDLAKQYYKSLLIDYPGSIFVSDARKKYRSLRGDKSIN